MSHIYRRDTNGNGDQHLRVFSCREEAVVLVSSIRISSLASPIMAVSLTRTLFEFVHSHSLLECTMFPQASLRTASNDS